MTTNDMVNLRSTTVRIMVSHWGHNCIFDAFGVEWTRCQVEMTLRRNMLLYYNVKFDALPS